MSRRGRDARLVEAIFGPVVLESDLRMTPRRTVESILDADPPPMGRVLDCNAGNGAFLRVLKERGYQPEAVELREAERPGLEAICGRDVLIADFLACRYSAIPIVSNPAFSIARYVATHALEVVGTPWLQLLLRCNTLGSNPWRPFWAKHPPTRIRQLERPSFPKPGQTDYEAEDDGTDMSDYIVCIWVAGEPPININPI